MNKSNRIRFFVFSNQWSVVSVYYRSLITDYRLLFIVIMRLVKFQLSLMVTFSAMTGYFLSGKTFGSISWFLLFGVLFLSAGSSGLNQLQERHYDLLMERTRNRPLPSKKISVILALVVSLILIIAGALFLGYLGWLPMILGLSNVVIYNLIYTPLKRFTWLAIIPGALVGALTPLIGWTSGGSYIFHPVALFLAGFVFLWQLPHFWLLMIRYRKDYQSAGFSSLSGFMNESRIKNLIFLWTFITSIYLFSFHLFGINLWPSVIIAFALLNFLFIILFYRALFGKETNRSLRSAFILINSFAFFVFLVLIFGSH